MCMAVPPVRVPPDPKYSAEVVVLVTTLGAKRTEFNAGKRARDLMEIKRVHHKIIDFNRDARHAGTGESENIAIRKLMEQNKLKTGENDDLVLPQLFVDGLYIGDANSLQGLEDDGLLESILLRRACPKCCDLRREPDTKQCIKCGEKFEEILPGMMTIEQLLRELAMVNEGDYDEDYDGDYGEADWQPPVTTTLEPEIRKERFMATCSPRGPGTVVEGVAGRTPPPAAAPLAAAPVAPVVAPVPATAAPAPAQAQPAVAAAAQPGVTIYKPGDQVQYWSDTKNRWVDACVVAQHEKDGVIKYDLNCKRGAAADKVRRPGSG